MKKKCDKCKIETNPLQLFRVNTQYHQVCVGCFMELTLGNKFSLNDEGFHEPMIQRSSIDASMKGVRFYT